MYIRPRPGFGPSLAEPTADGWVLSVALCLRLLTAFFRRPFSPARKTCLAITGAGIDLFARATLVCNDSVFSRKRPRKAMLSPFVLADER
jgi:hypothetical protein